MEERNPGAWLKERAVAWLEKGLVGPRHVRRILAAEGLGELPSLPRRFGARATAMGAVGLVLLAAGLWHSYSSGRSVVAWQPRLIISLLVMAASYGSFLGGRLRRAGAVASEVTLAVGLLAFGLATAAVAEGAGLVAGSRWAFLLTGLLGLALSWLSHSGLILLLSTLSLGAWMVHLGVYQQSLNLWFPVILLGGVLPLSLWLRFWPNLPVIAVALPMWLGLATKPHFSAVELFLPFTLVLWGGLWALAGEVIQNRSEALGNTAKWTGLFFLLGSLGTLSLHALGVSQAQTVLANPGWRTRDAVLLLVTNALVSVLILGFLVLGLRRRALRLWTALTVAVATAATWFYFAFPETIPRELAGSLLPTYFLHTPFAFGLITLLALIAGLWLGYRSGDGFLFYLSLVGLVVFAGVRYFDPIWAKLPRSFFLYLNGIVLCLLWCATLRKPNQEGEKSE
ncbi:MAG: hypothetical protein ONB23_06765 [candidate division KSB1 bacterium]|nr:hypothetical protein [candidate division KSB1 bacterium]